MKILTILGSPRKQGNTNAILRLFEELASSSHQVERINVLDFNIHGCNGCDACQEILDEPGCVEEDDLVAILGKISAADLVIYAAPVYVWSFPAQMKALIDRHYCTVKWQGGEKVSMLLNGKRADLLLTCGGSEAENADLIRLEFQREMNYIGGQVTGVYVVANCGTPRETIETGKGADVAQKMLDDLQALS
jgi:multimeric flavodoxin WrbA